MSQTRRSLRIIAGFTLVFVISGVLHMTLYGVSFANSAVQLYVSVAVLLWAYTLRRRIINKALLRYLYVIVFLMELLSMAQAGRYALFTDPNLERYCWYTYYVPFILIPLFFNQVAFRLNMQKNNRIKQWWKLIDIPSIVLFFLVVTNDFHQIVFQFPEGLEKGVRVYTHGIAFFCIWILVIVQNIISLVIIFRQCRVNASRKMLWLPAFFELIFIAGQLMHFGDSFLRINGTLIWNQGEYYIFSMVGLAESCIAMGLIPANMNYKKLFHLVNDMAVIYDRDNTPVYSSEAAEEMFARKSVVVNSNTIRSGKVCYGVDMGPVYELNRTIQEENDRIQARNRLLQSQNSLESEKSRLNAQNELYDNISFIVKPKLDKIQSLIEESTEENFNNNLAKIAVYNAYVKRRSNLELLAGGSTVINIRELTTAIHESLEYLKLSKTDTMMTNSEEGELLSEEVILFYEFFERVVEEYLDSLKTLMVSFSKTGEEYRLSLLLDAEKPLMLPDYDKEKTERFGGYVFTTEEDGGKVISLSLKGGIL